MSHRKGNREVLTQARVREMFDYDPLTGVMSWRQAVNSKSRIKPGDPITTRRQGYVIVTVAGGQYRTHRLIWLYVHGAWPEMIDHINGNPADNRLANLRDATPKINSQNKRNATYNSKSGLIGAHHVSATGHWQAAIKADGRQHYIGNFDTAQAAHEAYVAVKRKLHEGNTL